MLVQRFRLFHTFAVGKYVAYGCEPKLVVTLAVSFDNKALHCFPLPELSSPFYSSKVNENKLYFGIEIVKMFRLWYGDSDIAGVCESLA